LLRDFPEPMDSRYGVSASGLAEPEPLELRVHFRRHLQRRSPHQRLELAADGVPVGARRTEAADGVIHLAADQVEYEEGAGAGVLLQGVSAVSLRYLCGCGGVCR
jgi:hypothetical protein